VGDEDYDSDEATQIKHFNSQATSILLASLCREEYNKVTKEIGLKMPKKFGTSSKLRTGGGGGGGGPRIRGRVGWGLEARGERAATRFACSESESERGSGAGDGEGRWCAGRARDAMWFCACQCQARRGEARPRDEQRARAWEGGGFYCARGAHALVSSPRLVCFLSSATAHRATGLLRLSPDADPLGA
jgi:hypothetical protein